MAIDFCSHSQSLPLPYLSLYYVYFDNKDITAGFFFRSVKISSSENVFPLFASFRIEYQC